MRINQLGGAFGVRRVADAAFPSSIRRLRNQKMGKRRPQPAPHSRLSPFFLFDGRNDDHRRKILFVIMRGVDVAGLATNL
ncbi:hypothetical protein L0337_02570 [candidate division KSB1 bacterium]|nr:hypothetical protein [candidate division KSB1 bacterium]